MANDMNTLWELTKDYKTDYEPDVELGLSRLKRRIQEESKPSAKVVGMPKRRNLGVFQIAAAIALVLGVGFLLNNYVINPTNYLSVQTAMGQTQTLSLIDGTVVSLNENSTLIYPDNFNKNQRKVTLKGEAFFDVAHNPNQQFVIETPKLEVAVLGTSFNLRDYDTEAIAKVQVQTGKVSFKPANSSKKLTLEKGQKGTFNRATRILKSEQDATGNDLSWFTGRLSFDNTQLSKVINDIEEHFKIKIILEDTRLASCGFTSINLPKNISIKEMIDTLKKAFNMKVEKEKNTYRLKGGYCQ